MKLEDLIDRVDELIIHGKDTLKTRRDGGWGDFVDSGQYLGFRSAGLSFLSNAFGRDHPYFREFDSGVSTERPSNIEQGIGVLQAAKHEMEGGWVRSTKGLISSSIFSDFLEMSFHLLNEGYKDPAAVMAGSVLEEHLRHLCEHNRIDTHETKNKKPIPRKASSLNSDLAKKGVISKLDEKAITAWLDLRNKAAHGCYDEYSIEQVQLLVQSVTDFMARVKV